MKIKYLFLIASFFLFSYGGNSNEMAIKELNKFVKTIDSAIKTDEYSRVVIDEFSEYEGSPATITFFFKKDSIMVAVKVSVGHETWINEFWYYFNNSGNIIKYLKKTIDRPDNPANRAIIYGKNKIILWQNIDEMAVSVNQIKELFYSIQKIRLKFAQY